MEKAVLVLVDGRGMRARNLLSPLFSDERLSKIARCQNEGAQIDSACAELAYLVSFKTAFGEIKKNLYAYKENNKPYFKETKYGCLSLAHARNTGACLIAPVKCGVDIEGKERDVSKIETKIRFSKGGEEAPPLTLWCAKESYVKLTGEGLSKPFSTLCFKDGSMLDENGKNLASTVTGEMRDFLWACSFEKDIIVQKVYLTAEQALALIKKDCLI